MFQPLPFTQDMAEKLAFEKWGVRVVPEAQGLQVAEVRKGSPAENTGLARGDKIRSVSGQPMRNLADFGREINNGSLGSKLMMVVGRGRDNYHVILVDR